MKIGYCRVSTADQNLDRQIDALEKYGCQIIFKEKLSGKNVNRPELQAMIEAAQPEDVIVVQKLDRLGRSLMDLFEIVTKLKEKEVGFISLTESIDTTSSHGRLIFNVLGSIAEFEREMILDRVTDGIRHAKKNGVKFGRRPKIDREAFEIDYLAKMRNSDLAVKYQITPMTVHRNIKRIKAQQKCQAPGESVIPHPEAL